MKEQTRKEMQRKMADFRMSAPEVSWADIEQAVGVRPRAAVLRRRLTVAAAAVGLLLAGGMVFRMLHRAQPEGPAGPMAEVMDVHEVFPPTGGIAGPAPAPSSTPAPGLSSGPSSAPAPGRRVASNLVASNEESLTGLSAASEVGPGERSVDAPGHDAADDASGPGRETTYPGNDRTGSGGHPDFDVVSVKDAAPCLKRATGPRLTAQAFMGNAMLGYAGSSSFTPMLMSAPPLGIYDEEMAGGEIVSLRSDNPQISTDVRHHRPVRFGLTLRYGVGNRWSVESGLAFSLQKSEFTNRTGDRSVVTEQHLAYVGIPLNAGYRIWSGGGFHFYAAAGGMVEKMVKGSRTVQSVMGEKPKDAAVEDICIRPLQFSLNGAVGAEYRIGRSLGLYAEPGLTYHFDNGSAVPSLYRDEPLDFNLTLGLRFTLP